MYRNRLPITAEGIAQLLNLAANNIQVVGAEYNYIENRLDLIIMGPEDSPYLTQSKEGIQAPFATIGQLPLPNEPLAKAGVSFPSPTIGVENNTG